MIWIITVYNVRDYTCVKKKNLIEIKRNITHTQHNK